MKTLPQPSKKPRVTNALQLFGEANKDAIVKRRYELTKNDGPKEAGDILNLWKQCRKEMYDAADPETKAKYEVAAAEANGKLGSPPAMEEIYTCVIFFTGRKPPVTTDT
jgi:hypothetical protein